MDRTEPAKAYQAAAIKTATPGQLVLVLFDGALRFMATAMSGFRESDLPTKIQVIHTNLIKAQRILRELQASLDMEKGDEFSQRMSALYDFMIAQLTEANIAKKPEPIHIVQNLLGQIRDAWAQVLSQSNRIPA